MDGLFTAVIGIGGAAIGALLTWSFNYLTEIQKSILQKEQTKFTSYHAKQIDVLAEIYKKLSIISLEIDYMLIDLPNKHDVSSKSWNEYINSSTQSFSRLTSLFDEFKVYFRTNAVFIDDEMEEKIILVNKLITKLQFIRGRNPFLFHLLKPNDTQSSYHALLSLSRNDVHKTMTEVKSKVKQTIRG